MKNFDNYKFRCSGLSNIMTKSRTTDPLSQTTRTYLKELWIKEVYGRDREYQTITKFTQKGTMVESDSLDLFEEVTGQKYFKNIQQLENEFVKGSPDIVKPLIDVKSSWDIFTFAKVDESYVIKEHKDQVIGYCWLTGQRKAEIVYALVNTPDILVNDEMFKLSFKISEAEADKYKNNFNFNDIAAKDKIKRYALEITDAEIELLQAKILLCREYMNSLSL